MENNFILASKSPRRRELFNLITDNFTSVESSVDEGVIEKAEPNELCLALARLKCLTVAEEYADSTVIGCDTVVSIDGEILGKPVDRADAHSMLRKLSGRTHDVYTGVFVKTPLFQKGIVCKTVVSFYPITDKEIDDYINTGDPFDKAGAYGIQNKAARFVESINGDYFNVMGLPLSRLYRLLVELDLISG